MHKHMPADQPASDPAQLAAWNALWGWLLSVEPDDGAAPEGDRGAADHRPPASRSDGA
jgi:hypothetical protein